MSRFLTRRFLVAALVVLLALLLFKISYFQENQEAYLFPAIITGVMLFFSIVSLVREAYDLCVDDFKSFPFLILIPGLVIIVAAVFSLEKLGMYLTTSIALFLMSAWYSPQPSMGKRLRNSLLLAVGFILFMYVLFSLMLGVQMPRGILM